MAVAFSSLPASVQEKIEKLGYQTIYRIIEFHYPTKIEYGIYGIDSQGRCFAHIFSI